MKTYKIEVIITEGSDEFWNDIHTREVSGCDEVLKEVKVCLAERGFDAWSKTTVKLITFMNE